MYFKKLVQCTSVSFYLTFLYFLQYKIIFILYTKLFTVLQNEKIEEE